MKILTINAYFSPLGGAELLAFNTYKLLKEMGQESYFWGCDKKPYYEEDYPDADYFTKYNGGSKNYIKNPFKYYYNLSAQKDLKKYIEKIKPEVIHLHNIFGLTTSVLKCCKDIPTVMTLHDAKMACPACTMMYKNKTFCTDMKCNNFRYYNCLINNCAQKGLEASIRYTLFAYTNTKNYKYINKYIAPSDALKNIIVNANIGINQNDVTTVNTYLSKDEADITPNYSNNGYFMYIGRLDYEKGVQYLLEAAKDLPDINFHIIGKGSYKDKLTEFAEKNNLRNVKFFGYVSVEELKNEYQNCIATILPCNWFENCPKTTIEGFMHGKPAIASKIGGLPEQIEQDKTGLLFTPANVEELKECILKYYNNNNLVLEHGKNAYNKAVEQYSEDMYYKKIISVYNSAIESMNK